jgi:dTDP-4-dehydrorhamnose reductase
MFEEKRYRIAVTGSNGQLGRELQRISNKFPKFSFYFLTREIFPLDDFEKLRDWLDQNPVDIFVHAAAYTAVDKAESEKEKALLINATASELIASFLSKNESRLIYISTDYVFDGSSAGPLTEKSVTNPINWYGSTKLEGERLVLNNNPNTLVLRTSWVFSAFGNNFVKTMIRLMKAPTVRVVDDQVGSPTSAADLSKALMQIIESENFVPGIFHYCNEGQASWYQFATAIRDLTGSSCQVIPISTSEFPTAAKRPAFSLLDNSKVKKVYGLDIPNWKTSLEKCIQELKEGVY